MTQTTTSIAPALARARNRLVQQLTIDGIFTNFVACTGSGSTSMSLMEADAARPLITSRIPSADRAPPATRACLVSGDFALQMAAWNEIDDGITLMVTTSSASC